MSKGTITPPEGGRIIMLDVSGKNLILLSYPNGGGSFDKAVNWANQNGLGMSSSSDVLAIINTARYNIGTFGAQSICVVTASTTISGVDGRSVINVWFSGENKGNGTMTVDSIGDPDEWIAFVEVQ